MKTFEHLYDINDSLTVSICNNTADEIEYAAEEFEMAKDNHLDSPAVGELSIKVYNHTFTFTDLTEDAVNEISNAILNQLTIAIQNAEANEYKESV